MTETSSGHPARLSLFYALCFAGIGVYMPFFPLWLERRGLEAATIGVILSLPIVTRVVVTAPVVSLVDRGIGPRRLLMVTSFGLALAYASLVLARDPLAIAALVLIMAVAQAPIIPLCDLVATDMVRANPRLHYGRIRMWGSIAFLICSVLGGYVLGATTPDVVIWVLAGLCLMTLAAVPFAVPRSSEPKRAHLGGQPVNLASALPARLLYLMAAAACIQASHAGLYAFGSLHWKAQGFSEPVIGSLWATGVVAEIALFALSGRLVAPRSGGLALLLVGGAGALLRFTAMAYEPGVAATFGLQALHGLSFGATHLGIMVALAEFAPPALRGRAQGWLSTGLALGMAAATVASGVIFRAAGASVFAAMAPLAALGLVFCLPAARASPAHPQRAGEGG